jgi:hypothetical protein
MGTTTGRAIYYSNMITAGSSLQPNRQRELEREDARGHNEDDPKTPAFDNRAADQIRQRLRERPRHVVNADHPLQPGALFTFAHERFQGGPGETDSEGRQQCDEDMRDKCVEKCAGANRRSHEAESKFQCQEVAAPLGKTPSNDRSEHVKKSQQCREGEILQFAKAEIFSREEVEVEKVRRRRERVQRCEREISRFQSGRLHVRGGQALCCEGGDEKVRAENWHQ